VVGRNWQRGPAGLINWKGEAVGPVQRSGGASECAIHRAGKTVAKYFTEWEAPEGVPISAFILAGEEHVWRRWCTNRLTGSTECLLAPRWRAETTAAATGDVGITRRDPMACCLLRVQHGGLFWALAGDGEENTETAEDFSRELVPQGRGWKIPVAGYGENVRVLKDIGARGRPRPSAGDADRVRTNKERANTGRNEDFRGSGERIAAREPEDWENEMDDSKQFFASSANDCRDKFAKSRKSWRGDSRV